MEYVDNFIKLLYEFQCSSASRKFLNKYYVDRRHCMHISFSALQRAENSSILKQGNVHQRKHCGFSALQRAENSSIPKPRARTPWSVRFSALQRAENSSIDASTEQRNNPTAFQCSSASRKFLNSLRSSTRSLTSGSFSALQRAENSSIFLSAVFFAPAPVRFSALQRAENSSIDASTEQRNNPTAFQCSSASRKFLNGRGLANGRGRVHRFSALQRAENSSMIEVFAYLLAALGFSALQRAENSSIRASRDERYMHDRFSALQRAENSSMRLARCGGPVSISFSALQRAENSSMRDRSSAI